MDPDHAHDYAPMVDGEQSRFPLSGYVRRVRRTADLSQRELARAVAVSISSIRRMETDAMDPRLSQLTELLSLVGWRLAVIDEKRREIRPMLELDGDLRDGADRRYPPHLDLILDPDFGQWWADIYGLTSPPETFDRSRDVRDWRRARSQWELGRARRRRPDWR
jgi:transcriptional regulator with XRE-family HTH domain